MNLEELSIRVNVLSKDGEIPSADVTDLRMLLCSSADEWVSNGTLRIGNDEVELERNETVPWGVSEAGASVLDALRRNVGLKAELWWVLDPLAGTALLRTKTCEVAFGRSADEVLLWKTDTVLLELLAFAVAELEVWATDALARSLDDELRLVLAAGEVLVRDAVNVEFGNDELATREGNTLDIFSVTPELTEDFGEVPGDVVLAAETSLAIDNANVEFGKDELATREGDTLEFSATSELAVDFGEANGVALEVMLEFRSTAVEATAVLDEGNTERFVAVAKTALSDTTVRFSVAVELVTSETVEFSPKAVLGLARTGDESSDAAVRSGDDFDEEGAVAFELESPVFEVVCRGRPVVVLGKTLVRNCPVEFEDDNDAVLASTD